MEIQLKTMKILLWTSSFSTDNPAKMKFGGISVEEIIDNTDYHTMSSPPIYPYLKMKLKNIQSK